MKLDKEAILRSMIDEIDREAFDAWHWNKESGQYMGLLDKEICKEVMLRWMRIAKEEHIKLV